MNQTLICGLSLAGPLAPLVLEGALNGELFEWSVREEVCPTLTVGQVVIMDNLSSHHRASVRTLMEARGCELRFLPPYSPNFDPIELMFSKLKATVRGGNWRVIQESMNGAGTALAAVTTDNIRNWFKHAHPKLLLSQML